MKIYCPQCFTVKLNRNGRTKCGYQRYICTNCNYQFTLNNSTRRKFLISDMFHTYPVDQIAIKLGISERTVLRYISKIKKELPKTLII